MTVRIGIISFAHAHVRTYCREWISHPEQGIEVAGAWDADPDRLARSAAQLGVPPEASLDALLAGDIDAVVIGSETARHAEHVERAAAAGKTVILQKPVATTLKDADRIVSAVEKSGVAFTMAWQMRADPENLFMADLVRSGTLGRVYTVRRRHGLATHRMAGFANSWHVDPELNRDIWADDAAHAFDFLYWILGMPVSVTAELTTLRDSRVCNDHGMALLRYADGALAEVNCSFVLHAHENTTEIVAEKGVVIQNHGDGPSLQFPPSEGSPRLKWMVEGDTEWRLGPDAKFAGQGERIANLAAPLAAFLRGERAPVAGAEEGRDVLRILLAGYESNQRGERVTLS